MADFSSLLIRSFISRAQMFFNPAAKMLNYNNMEEEEATTAWAMKIDRLSDHELLLSIQGFGTQPQQPLLFNRWKKKMVNYNTEVEVEVEEVIERLSALPDDLLLDILGRLDNTNTNMNMKEAARTAALSKRWRFLWTKLPLLSFSSSLHAIARSFALVREALAACKKEASTNKDYCRLDLQLYYDDILAEDLIALFYLASASRVSDVDFKLISLKSGRSLPQALYSYPTLTKLSLESFNLVPPATTVEWRLMTEISLVGVSFSQTAFDQIVSGCPLLSRLGIHYCWGFDRLDVGGRSFRELDVASISRPELEISAPYMTILKLNINPVRTTLRLTNVSFVEQLSLCSSNLQDSETTTTAAFVYNDQLFQLLQRVTTLVLHRFLQVVSNMMKNGEQLPQFGVRHLTIRDDIVRDNKINDVLSILESSPFLDKLVIRYTCECERSHTSYQDPSVDLICDLLHLKSVEIIFEIGQQHPRTLSFALPQILLRRAPVLEEMVIKVEKISDYSELFSELVKKFNTLLTHPKSSSKALVSIVL